MARSTHGSAGRWVHATAFGMMLATGCTTHTRPGTAPPDPTLRLIDSDEDWHAASASSRDIRLDAGHATLASPDSLFSSAVHRLDEPARLRSVTFRQTPAWDNWQPIPSINPKEQADATVLLALGDADYWLLGRHTGHNDGYHAWHSDDMRTWQHHGPVSDHRARWVTTAEHVDGTFYIYYDHPNDTDPHLIIDDDLTDGTIGRDMGRVYESPSAGSDCSVIRDEDGRFHMIHEDWSPINARTHSWDSPLGGHAVSPDGVTPFELSGYVIDRRTTPTGETGVYDHPHITPATGERLTWEKHEPEQDAFGDYTTIKVGQRFYTFCDYDPAGGEIRVGRWTTTDLDTPFEFCGEFGVGHHPDPAVCFAEGRFWVVVQRGPVDFISPGPWVDGVEARAGVDTDGDSEIDTWTAWCEVHERYDHAPGFARIVRTTPAMLDTADLPEGLGFAFEFRACEAGGERAEGVTPVLDAVTLRFER